MFDTQTYSPAILDLLTPSRLAPLGPGRPNDIARPKLEKLTLAEPGMIRDPNLAQACLAGLWLYHDFLDESHRISQDLSTVEGSYWHGLMHRREPDFSNSKYWFRHVGRHDVFVPLAQAAAHLARTADPHPAAEFLTAGKAWDPFAFIDLCEQSCGGRAPCERLCRLIQEQEWRLLFDHCYQHALKGS